MSDFPLLIGVMSGTSADGIDVAIARMDANGKPALEHYREHPMPEKLREPILRLAEPGMDEIDALGELDRALGQAFAKAVLATIDEAGLKCGDIAAIGSHGQTIRHRPNARYAFSLQIGCPSTIAEMTGITTIADFRRRDIAAGGQGAPLTPFAHRAIFGDPRQPVAVLNIGGIANVTCITPDDELLGFDTGPGNMVMDGLMLALTDGRNGFDAEGGMAATGKICQPLLDELMSHPFFHKKPPRSCGREEFGRDVVHAILAWPALTDSDRVRTALELTVQAIVQSLQWLPARPARWHVCGGGVRNRFLLSRLAGALAPAEITTTDEAGMPAQALEAVAFALLAWHALQGVTNTLREVTGAGHAVCGGHIVPGKNWPELLQSIPTWTRSPTP
ncbi:MAG: anhydro-N-acetylmuramic acid kinase [Mariprofundaceae bacterium]|nr:anhydro-N-acetylmuramic acid kinase [Mariprofundaceae bacterium]